MAELANGERRLTLAEQDVRALADKVDRNHAEVMAAIGALQRQVAVGRALIGWVKLATASVVSAAATLILSHFHL